MPLFLCKKITAALKAKSAAVIFMLILIFPIFYQCTNHYQKSKNINYVKNVLLRIGKSFSKVYFRRNKHKGEQAYRPYIFTFGLFIHCIHPKTLFFIFFIEEYTKSGRAHRSMMPSAVDTAEGSAAPIIFDNESVSDTSDITIRLTDQIRSIFLSILLPLFYESYNSYILLLYLAKVNIL